MSVESVPITGTEPVTLPISQDAVKRAGDNVELFEIEGATHVALYDKDPYVAQAEDKLAGFFGKNLQPPDPNLWRRPGRRAAPQRATCRTTAAVCDADTAVAAMRHTRSPVCSMYVRTSARRAR